MRAINKYLKASTKAGQNIIERGMRDIGYDLHDVYTAFSYDKYKAWSDCIALKNSMMDSTGFGICSKNSFGFTCSWNATIDLERVLIYCTPSNTYCVYLDR